MYGLAGRVDMCKECLRMRRYKFRGLLRIIDRACVQFLMYFRVNVGRWTFVRSSWKLLFLSFEFESGVLHLCKVELL